jgi:hypothetical protein
LYLKSTIESSLIHNDFIQIPKVERAVTYLNKTTKTDMSNIVSSIIEKNESQQSETPANLIKLILQNKFIDLQWEIVFDDKSSQIKNISQVKIRVNFIYLNLATMKKESLMFILKENEFNDMLIEFNSLQKNF